MLAGKAPSEAQVDKATLAASELMRQFTWVRSDCGATRIEVASWR